RVANRIHKVLEDANIKLGSVATDILGVSGRDILEGLMAGEEDVEKLTERARGKLRGKIPQLRRALQGRLTEHHRFQLRLNWEHLRRLEELVERLDQRISELCEYNYGRTGIPIAELPGGSASSARLPRQSTCFTRTRPTRAASTCSTWPTTT